MGKIKCTECIYMMGKSKHIVTTVTGEKVVVDGNNCKATEEIQLTIYGETEKVYNLCTIVNNDGKCRFYKRK